jgi:hypothetical protein
MTRLVSLLAVLLLSGCQLFSAARFDEVAGQPDAATLRKVLLAGVAMPEFRQETEQELQRRLQGEGHELILSGQWWPDAEPPAQARMLQRADAEGATGVLVISLQGYADSGSDTGASGFSLYTPSRSPGTRVGWEQEGGMRDASVLVGSRALLEARLYDVKTGEAVWQARSAVLLGKDEAAGFRRFAAAVAAELRRSGWR